MIIARITLLAISCAALCVPCSAQGHGVRLWDATHPGLESWGDATGLNASVKSGALRLDVTGADSRLTRTGLAWTPGAEDTFLIRYRAANFTVPRTSGEIFFVNAAHGVDGTHYAILPSLNLDGEWHDLRVPVKDTMRGGVADWTNGGEVALLRFDFVNEAPGTIEIANIFLSSGMRVIAEEEVAVDAPFRAFLSASSFVRKDASRFERSLKVPDGAYAVWAHVFDSPAALEDVKAFHVGDAAAAEIELGDSSVYRWAKVADANAGNITMRLERAPSAMLDAVLVVRGDGVPRDLPPEVDEPVHSTIAPGKAARAPITIPAPHASVPCKGPLQSEVRIVDGVPRLFVNSESFYPMVGNGTSFDMQGTREAYARAGFNIDAMWVDGDDSPQWWKGPGEYDFTAQDALIADDLVYNPDVLMLPIVWAAPPPWWKERFPEEIARFSDGTTWEYYRSTPSFASARWKADAAEALKAFVSHYESMPYAGRILGYWIVGGVSAEWQGWGVHSAAERKHLMDYSVPARDGFRAFLSEKYAGGTSGFSDAEPPSYGDRLKGGLGVFRDPVEARRSIDYDAFYAQSLADMLLSCTRAAKEATGRKKIVGVYFGYSLEYANMSWCLQAAGHSALRKVLDSPDVDFLSAPPSYGVRAIGQSIGWMWPWRSIQTAGKLVWVDDDTRTFLSGECDYTPAVNLDQTLNVLRRNFGTALCRLCPQGFLQLTSGRELDDPAIARDMQIFRRAGEYALRKGVRRKAEIAVVIDEDSVKYLRYDDAALPSGETDRILAWNGDVHRSPRRVNTLTGDLLSHQRDRIARIGAPVDYILWSDLLTRELDYKCYIMLDCFQYDGPLLRALREKIYGKPVTVLWCYAPGFIRDGTAAVENMQALTGIGFKMLEKPMSPRTNLIDFATPFADASVPATFGVEYAFAPQFCVDDPEATPLGVYQANGAVSLAAKRIGETQVVFCGSNKLPPAFMRRVAANAGVHIYEDAFDPCEANDSFLMVHATTPGEKTFHLAHPADVIDVFTGETLFRQVQAFAVEIPKQTTRLFFVGNGSDFEELLEH